MCLIITNDYAEVKTYLSHISWSIIYVYSQVHWSAAGIPENYGIPTFDFFIKTFVKYTKVDTIFMWA